MPIRLFTSKKASMTGEVYNFLITVAIIIFIAFSIMGMVSKLRDQTQFKHTWLHEDQILSLLAMQASPGHVQKFIYINREFNLGQYQYEFDKDYSDTITFSKGNQLKITSNPTTTEGTPVTSLKTYPEKQSQPVVQEKVVERKVGLILDEDSTKITVRGTTK
jgi:hypothetical protein